MALFLAKKQSKKDFRAIQYDTIENDIGINALDEVGRVILWIKDEKRIDDISFLLKCSGAHK